MPAGVLGNTAQESWWALCAAALFESCTVHHKKIPRPNGPGIVVDGMGLEQGGSAVSGLQISLYRRCSFLDRCGILGLVQQIGIYKGEY